MPQPPPADRLRLIIVDDDALARRAVKEVLQDAGLTVIAEARTGREAVELVLHYEPDVVLMDVVMPGIDGIEATRQILAARPNARIVLLTSAEEAELAIVGLRSGAVGFLAKDVDLAALPRALAGVVAGEAAISRQLAMRLVERLRRSRQGTLGLRPVRSGLSGREWEVLDLLCAGRGTDDIAAELVLSTETVRSHVKSIFRKLEVSSRADAIAVAARLREEEPDALMPV